MPSFLPQLRLDQAQGGVAGGFKSGPTLLVGVGEPQPGSWPGPLAGEQGRLSGAPWSAEGAGAPGPSQCPLCVPQGRPSAVCAPFRAVDGVVS